MHMDTGDVNLASRFDEGLKIPVLDVGSGMGRRRQGGAKSGR